MHDTEWKLRDDGRIFHVATDPFEERPLSRDDLSPVVRQRIERFRAVLEARKNP